MKRIIKRLKEKKASVSIFTLFCVLGLTIILFSVMPYSSTAINLRNIRSVSNKTLETVMTNNFKSFAYNEYKVSSNDEYSEEQKIQSLKSLVGSVSQSLYLDNVEYYKDVENEITENFGDSVIKEMCDALNASVSSDGPFWLVAKDTIEKYNSKNELLYKISGLKINSEFMTHLEDCEDSEDFRNDDVLKDYLEYGSNNELVGVTVPIEYKISYHNRLPYSEGKVFNRTVSDNITYMFGVM